MDVWVGPAIIAALVSALVSAAGWFVTSWQAQRLESQRRKEKVTDFQIALRAEILSDLIILEVPDRERFFLEVSATFDADPQFTPIIPGQSRNVVFEAIVRDIPILPDRVITPVIHYARMRQTLDQFIADMRSDVFRELSPARKLTMYRDYLGMQQRLEILAREAVTRLDFSISSWDADLPSQGSASGARTASASAEPGAWP